MDEDNKEEQKKADVDRSKLEADIKAQKELASKVSTSSHAVTSKGLVPAQLENLNFQGFLKAFLACLCVGQVQ